MCCMKRFVFIITMVGCCLTLYAQHQDVLEPLDVFDIEYVSDPQIEPAGQGIAYVRNGRDIMKDGSTSGIWFTDFTGEAHYPILTGPYRYSSPRWSPDGKRLAYLSNESGSNQIHCYYLDSGLSVKLTQLTFSPSGISWSPDGQHIAFRGSIPVKTESIVSLPTPPKGAKWEDRPTYIDQLRYRADGSGMLKKSFSHIYLIRGEGGHARQLTSGDFNHNAFSWAPDSKSLVLSANRHEDAEYQPVNSELYRLDLDTGELEELTDRVGPDNNPVISPDGSRIAYTGYDDEYLGYQPNQLYIMDQRSGKRSCISDQFDYNISNVQWVNSGLYFQYDKEGNTKIARIDPTSGEVETLTNNVGGMSLGRPYAGGTFSVAQDGRFAYTHSTPDHPADLAVGQDKTAGNRLTEVNQDLFAHKTLGRVEEIWYTSSYDGRRIQGWICKPPHFDPNKKYPLILEIHGGPFSNYGDRFSLEVQLFAAAGYVVLYTNPRGSTSYGKAFGNLIHHNYPNQDYDDLISGVDAVMDQGYIDEDQLYVTGGSGGGVLTAWIVGKTDRFRAAVVAKPVINWYSFVLHADNPAFFYRYWFPGYPWEHLEHYMKRSPISLVGNVNTPTMLLTGEQDYRTPMSETEQYYAALKLRKVPSAMVRIQGAGHGIVARPSNLINKVSYILGWFEKYKSE